MKTSAFALLFFLMLGGINLSAQNIKYSEGYGNTLNVGLGVGGYAGYYGYVGHTMPVLNINYEFGVANNFTLAPFVTFYTYLYNYYRETVIPIAGKATYYFDQILRAGKDWDFYLAGSLGFTIVYTSWDNGYYLDNNYHTVNPLFLDLHLGTEYHISQRVEIFLDFSTGLTFH
ncbi:MAG: hypothetical protein M1445_01285 [Bacteroidetes bacterium]|nr:hypothetical protein [Bacteroidota bacterium]